VTRKYAIPLLEYLDRERVTRRAGDKRIILSRRDERVRGPIHDQSFIIKNVIICRIMQNTTEMSKVNEQ